VNREVYSSGPCVLAVVCAHMLPMKFQCELDLNVALHAIFILSQALRYPIDERILFCVCQPFAPALDVAPIAGLHGCMATLRVIVE